MLAAPSARAFGVLHEHAGLLVGSARPVSVESGRNRGAVGPVEHERVGRRSLDATTRNPATGAGVATLGGTMRPAE